MANADFGCTPKGCTYRGSLLFTVEIKTPPKIGDLPNDLSLGMLVHEYVCRFDVAMNHAYMVKGGDSKGNIDC